MSNLFENIDRIRTWVIIDAEDKKVSGLNAIRYILKNVPYEPKNEKILDAEYPEVLAVLKPQS